MESSTSYNIPTEDEIQVISNEEGRAEDVIDENTQLLLNISIDKIDNGSTDSINTDTESYSSNSSAYQMSTMEKFNFIATRILYSKYFQYYYFVIVVISVISLALTFVLDCSSYVYLCLEGFILLALTLEIIIRLLAKKKYYFCSFWNIFDIIILVLCIWFYYVTETNCPLGESDSVIDNAILIIRYIIQFIRLGILLKKNKTSGGNKKRKSVNFSIINGKPNYGSFEPYSRRHRKGKRKSTKSGERVNVEEEGEEEEEDGGVIDEGDSNYNTISSNIDPRMFNPYGVKYEAINNTSISNIYGNSIPNDTIISPNNMSQSLARDYANYLQGSQGSIDINIDSNAYLAKMFYRDESNGDLESKKSYHSSINSVNNDVYQKLIHSSVEENNKSSYGGLPHPSSSGADRVLSSSTQQVNGVEKSLDSISTNPIESSFSSIISPSTSYHKKNQFPPHSQKSFSSDVSFSISLPPKVGRKQQNRIAQTNHSSTFNEVPSRINLLTPILYGSPGTFTSSKN